MTKLSLLALLCACGGSVASTPLSATAPAHASKQVLDCSVPRNADVKRYAIGVRPTRMMGLPDDSMCPLEFTGDAVRTRAGRTDVVAEGRFVGRCVKTGDELHFEAAAATKATFDEKDRNLALTLGDTGTATIWPYDRCGENLDVGAEFDDFDGDHPDTSLVKWAPTGCDKIVAILPLTALSGIIKPIGPGTCTLTGTLLGLKADVIQITVK